MCAAVACVGALVYLILADGSLQPWGIPAEMNSETKTMSELTSMQVNLPYEAGAGTKPPETTPGNVSSL